MSDFLDILLKNRCSSTHYVNDIDTNVAIPNLSSESVYLNKTELNVVYYIAGYIIGSIIKNQKICNDCIKETASNKISYRTFNLLTRIRAHKRRLFFANKKTFRFFVQMEKIFRIYYPYVKNLKCNVKRFFVTKYKEIEFDLPECHNLKEKIVLRYHAFRVKCNSKTFKSKKRIEYASKSMAMHENMK